MVVLVLFVGEDLDLFRVIFDPFYHGNQITIFHHQVLGDSLLASPFPFASVEPASGRNLQEIEAPYFLEVDSRSTIRTLLHGKINPKD